MTGPDFQYVISTALGAEAHFKFKCEQEWEAAAENLGQLREEFFSLDLSSLESVGPFHYQLTHDSLLGVKTFWDFLGVATHFPASSDLKW